MYASHTKLECAESCLWRYKRRYIDKAPEVATAWPLLVGRAVHAAIAGYTRHCIEAGVATDLAAISSIALQACLTGDEAPGAKVAGETTDVLQAFAESHIIDGSSLVGLEERIPHTWRPPESWPEPNLGPHTFVGVIDRLDASDGRAIIIDYKTDWQVRSQAEVERDVQLRRYAWLVASQYPGQFSEFEVRLDFVRHGITRTVEFGLDVVAQTEEELRLSIDRLAATTEFPATPGEGCSICGYCVECPALSDGEIVACATPEQAERAAAQLIVLEKNVERLKDMLKAYCAQAGPVAVNGVQFGHLKSTSEGIEDAAAFTERVQAAGLDPWEYLAVDGRKLRGLLKKKPEVAEAVKDLLVDKSYTAFRSRKVGEEEMAS